jgi:transglutaminase-like putative cysteine protease
MTWDLHSGNKVGLDNPVEDSIGLRVITSAMAIVGILAACQMADTPVNLAIFAICGTILGSFVSYVRRDKNNFWIKWAIAGGILIVLRFFVEDIVFRVQASITDAREPLTNMMIALLALHCFDLPKRRDLNVSALVGLVLISSSATLSRDLTFGIYLTVFGLFGLYMLYLDGVSRTISGIAIADVNGASHALGSPTIQKGHFVRRYRTARLSALILIGLVAACAGIMFVCLPRFDLGLFRNVRVSLKLNIPMQSASQVSNPMLPHTRRQDGAIEVDPMAYFGFAKELDLNYRGALSKDIVLRVGSTTGEYWRAMAFDKFDGHRWTMSDPDTTYTRVSSYGSGIGLGEVPSLVVPRRVRTSNLTQVFYYEADQPNLVPAASVPYLIYFPIGNVEVDRYGAIRSPMFMDKDTVYTVFSHVPRYMIKALRNSRPESARQKERIQKRLANYLQVPQSLSPDLSKLAFEIAGFQPTWFKKAEAIDNFLKRTYKYNLDVPPTPENQEVVSDFLFSKKQGYCEHFATSFVVLCRLQGIPARLVTGFTPGEHNPLTGLWEVRMRDAHAWAEVFLPAWGWVPFDSTPDGALPGLPGKDAASCAQYLAEQIKWLCARLEEIPAVAMLIRDIGKIVHPLLQWMSGSVVHLWSIWSYVLLAFLLALAVISALKLAPVIVAFACVKRPASVKTEEHLHPASTEYLRVLKALESLAVERQKQDTPEDVRERLERCLQQRINDGLKVPKDLDLLVSQFLAQYEDRRFGAEELPAGESDSQSSDKAAGKTVDKMSQLCLISNKIQESVINFRNKD